MCVISLFFYTAAELQFAVPALFLSCCKARSRTDSWLFASTASVKLFILQGCPLQCGFSSGKVRVLACFVGFTTLGRCILHPPCALAMVTSFTLEMEHKTHLVCMNQVPVRSELVSLPSESVRCHLKAEHLNATRRCPPSAPGHTVPLPVLPLLVCSQLAAKLYA